MAIENSLANRSRTNQTCLAHRWVYRCLVCWCLVPAAWFSTEAVGQAESGYLHSTASGIASGYLPGTVQLQNGDYLQGHLVPASDPHRFGWKSPHFTDAIQFDVTRLERVKFVKVDLDRPSDVKHRIGLVDGQLIYSEVVGIDDRYVWAECARHGRMGIVRTAIERIDGMTSNSYLLWDGLDEKDKWSTPPSRDHTLDEWTLDSEGLHTGKHHAQLYRSYDHDGPLAVDVEIRSNQRPRFLIALDAVAAQVALRSAFSIETWGSRLVVHRQAGDKVEHTGMDLPALRDTGATIRMQLLFDPEQRKVIVFADGKMLGQFISSDARVPRKPGIYLRNQTQQMSVRRLRVRRWDGQTLPAIDTPSDAPQIWLSDGRVVCGSVDTYDRQSGMATITHENGNQESIALVDIEAVQFFPDTSSEPQDAERIPPGDTAATVPHVTALYAGGGRLQGNLVRVLGNGIEVKSPLVESNFLLSFSGAQHFEFEWPDAPPPPDISSTVLTANGCRLHGTMAESEDPGRMMWKPAFTDQVVGLQWKDAGRLTFDVTSTGAENREPDRVYLMNGDIVPCRVLGDDGTHTALQLGEHAPLAVDRRQIKAVEFLQHQLISLPPFSDGWNPLFGQTGLYEPAGDVLVFRGNTGVWCAADLPPSFHLRAECRWDTPLPETQELVIGFGEGEGAYNFRQFAVHTGKYLEVGVQRSGNSLTGRMLTSSMYTNASSSDWLPMLSTHDVGSSPTIAIDLYVDRQRRTYALYANGLHLASLHDRGGTRALGGNLVLQCRTESGRPVRMSVSRLTVARWAGTLEESQMERILTRRPGMKPDEVTHVVRAHNGDHLRGQLAGMTSDQVLFQSRGATTTIPRDRIAEIVALWPFEATPPAADTTAPRTPGVRLLGIPRAGFDGLLDEVGTGIGRAVAKAASARRTEATPADEPTICVGLLGGGWVTLQILHCGPDVLTGHSDALGEIAIPWTSIWSLGTPANSHAPYRLVAWRLHEPPTPPPIVADQPPTGPPGEAESEWVGKPAPSFAAQCLDQPVWNLGDQRGKVVVLDFWATWCGPCVRAMPDIIAATSQFPDDQVTLLGVNQQETREQIEPFLVEHGLSLQVALDSDGSIAQKYGVRGIPTTVVIGPDGQVTAMHVGAHPELRQWLADEIQRLLAKP